LSNHRDERLSPYECRIDHHNSLLLKSCPRSYRNRSSS
jgi:hypothetical protein